MNVAEVIRKTKAGADVIPLKGTPVLDRSDPYAGAEEFITREFTADGRRTIHTQAGVSYVYTGTHYRGAEESEIRSKLWDFQASALRVAKETLVPFKPTTATVNNYLDAVRARSYLGLDVQPPCWLDPQDTDPPPAELVAVENGLLHIATRELYPHSPRFYAHHALGFRYARNVPEPLHWLRFLGSLWPDDAESIAVLQEIIGYLLTTDTRHQKAFLIVGPKRSGKGTIGRVIRALLGEENVAGPTLSSLSTNFGLQPLIGKLLAIISDARLSSRADQAAIAERLLSISGEDAITIDRKHLPSWTGRLPTRFLILTNELPRLADASGALASRFIVLTLTRSFYGHEDTGLTDRLLGELPAIFAWALDGWERLAERGRFVQPAASAEAIRELEDLGSPISAFIRDRCRVEPGRQIECKALYAAWRKWCDEEGRDHPGTSASFGKDLRAAVPGIGMSQPRIDGRQVRCYEGIDLGAVWQ